MTWAYYNEWDPYAAQWLRNLIAAGHITDGEVDERDIREVSADDLKGFDRVHFFAGIAGWDLALGLAGWEGPVWTGSCPCTPLSSAARGRNNADDLWPAWRRLIAAKRPSCIFGEQVPDRRWADRLCDDMEGLGYDIGAAVLPAIGVGQDHLRHRFFFVCHTDGDREPSRAFDEEASGVRRHNGIAGNVVPANGFSRSLARVFSGFGNAIVPQVAAEFIRAYSEVA